MNDRKMVSAPGRRVHSALWVVFKRAWVFLLVAPALGCHEVRQTDPPRTATEQLLISTAADRAMSGVDFSWLKGKKVLVEDKYFESYDKGNAVSLIRQCLASAGGLLTTTNDKADLIVEIRSGALSINSSDTLFGIPSATAPVPLAGTIATPEIAFYKSVKEDSVAKFALFAYERETGAYVQSVGPIDGYAYFHLYKLIFFNWRRTDVPELKKHPRPPADQKPKWPSPQPGQSRQSGQ